MHYVQHGSVPRQRHTQHRAPDGTLYAEELFGVEGFTGRSSLLYHLVPPTRTHRVEAGPVIALERAAERVHRHHLVKTGRVGAVRATSSAAGCPSSSTATWSWGSCVQPRRCPPATSTATGKATSCSTCMTASGRFESVFGPLDYEPGDYLVIPIGTTWRLDPAPGVDQRMLWLETPGEIEPPRRYRNEYGQLMEHAPYYHRDIRVPADVPPHAETGDFSIDVKARGQLTRYHYHHHPLDVVGWDGYLYPYIFNIGDFQPITGRVHQPPPVHQTFQGPNFVVCSFVPRKFDYHPLAIPAPYNHSNINSDEVIYYVAGNFMSRRGVDISSFTVHPGGIPHGPHPGTAEASIGRESTEELAVMVDTFHPLDLTVQAAGLEDAAYPYSWLPADDATAEARELAERGPEAFPD